MDATGLSSQIDRILRSQTFARKSQLRKLLEVLVKHIDSQAQLNPDLVIRELWPEETRTKRPADVATEMNRLRHALKSYYADEGTSDPIAICLPNRAVGVNGTNERPWIVATPRGDEEEPVDHPPGWQENRSQVFPPRGLKKIILITALVAILGIAAYFSIRVLAVHDQPKFGRLDGSTLIIMNAEGKELWRKVFPDGLRKAFPEGISGDWYYGQAPNTRIWFADLEGNGHTDVLFLYFPADNPQSHSTTLICYSDRGKEKWRWTPGRQLPELAGSPATYWTLALGVLKATEKRPARIVVSSHGGPVRLQPSTPTAKSFLSTGILGA